MTLRSAIPWVAALGACLTHAQQAETRPVPKIEYRVSCVLSDDPHLHVDIRVTGLDRHRRDVRLELPGWGEWYDLDDYYVRNLRGTPPIRHDQEFLERFQFDLPDSWDGTLGASYDIPIVSLGGRAHANHGLLPWSAKTYVHGFSTNTLMRVAIGDVRQDADRRIMLVPPRDWATFTGWSGLLTGEQKLQVPPDGDNTLIVFGVPAAVAKSSECGGIEVVQFGAHPDRSAMLIDLARRMRSGYEKLTGAAPPCAGRIVVTEPGFGGTHVEGAITIGHPEVGADGKTEVGTAHFLAHEMFHTWLPGILKQGEPGYEWIHEGFTEYFSLWQLVSSGLATPEQFADRLCWYQRLAAASPAFGSVRFDDPAVKWRETDTEVIAYKGGALLAFHLDVALRNAGKPGLAMLFRDLVRENGSRYTVEAIRRWVEAQSLGDFWRSHVATGKLPDTGSTLARIGFSEAQEGAKRVFKSGPATAAFFTFTAPR